MCAPGWARPRVPHAAPSLGNRGQSCSWSFSPCRESSPGSSQLLVLAEAPPQQDQTFPELGSNSMALLCQLALFPCEKALFWLMEQHSLLPAPEQLCCRAPALCPRGRQHKGALWGRSWHNTAPTAAPELWQSTRVRTCAALVGGKQFCL